MQKTENNNYHCKFCRFSNTSLIFNRFESKLRDIRQRKWSYSNFYVAWYRNKIRKKKEKRWNAKAEKHLMRYKQPIRFYLRTTDKTQLFINTFFILFTLIVLYRWITQ